MILLSLGDGQSGKFLCKSTQGVSEIRLGFLMNSSAAIARMSYALNLKDHFRIFGGQEISTYEVSKFA